MNEKKKYCEIWMTYPLVIYQIEFQNWTFIECFPNRNKVKEKETKQRAIFHIFVSTIIPFVSYSFETFPLFPESECLRYLENNRSAHISMNENSPFLSRKKIIKRANFNAITLLVVCTSCCKFCIYVLNGPTEIAIV